MPAAAATQGGLELHLATPQRNPVEKTKLCGAVILNCTLVEALHKC